MIFRLMLARFRRWSANRNGQPRLVLAHATSLADYQSHAAAMAAEYHRHWRLELDLSDGDVPLFTPGHCCVCQRDVSFKTDFDCSSTRVNGKLIPNWRERVVCDCHLNNRTRASIQILEQYLGEARPRKQPKRKQSWMSQRPR